MLTIAGLKIDAEELPGVPYSGINPNGSPPKFRNGVLRQAAPMKHPDRAEDYLRDAVVRNIEIVGEAANKINRSAPDFIREASK